MREDIDERRKQREKETKRRSRMTWMGEKRGKGTRRTKEGKKKRSRDGGKEREREELERVGGQGGEERERGSIARLTGAQASYVLRLRRGIGRLGRL